MRVYVSVGMEGIAGIVHEDQSNPADPRCATEYARGRRLMTAEANAAVEEALAAGAGFILVMIVTGGVSAQYAAAVSAAPYAAHRSPESGRNAPKPHRSLADFPHDTRGLK